MASQRIGLFGGSFDPIHLGHLILAERAVEQLGLDRLYFIPNARSPLKSRAPGASGADRLALVRAAIRGNPRFRAIDLELRRPSPSYTIDTVAALGVARSVKLYFLIGTDAVSDLARWHRARELARRVTFAVLRRPGTPRVRPPAWVRDSVVIDAPLVEISSTDIRSRLRAKRSIRYLVPGRVETLIRKKRLYAP